LIGFASPQPPISFAPPQPQNEVSSDSDESSAEQRQAAETEREHHHELERLRAVLSHLDQSDDNNVEYKIKRNWI
jgi:hypothetical protein